MATMKSFINTVCGLMAMSAATLLGTMVAGCSDNEMDKPSARNWDIAVEAVIEGSTRTEATVEDIIHDFSTEDRVYVYNVTKRRLLEGSLKPLSGGSPATTLVSNGRLNGIVEAEDELIMTYIPFNWSPDGQRSFLKEGSYDPWLGGAPIPRQSMGFFQRGLKDEIMNFDYAESRVKVASTKGGVIQVGESTAKFTHLQSIFQLSFRFVDEEGNDIGVDALDMEGEPIYIAFWDDNLQVRQDIFSLYPRTMDGNIYVALPIPSYYHFTKLISSFGKYEGSLNAPEGTFHNGKIYCPTEPIVMKREAPHLE